MRDPVSLIMLYLVIQHFKFRNVLEMGFYQGLSLAAMIEAAPVSTKFTTIDIEFRCEIFNQHFADWIDRVTWLNMSTHDFRPNQTYDFILVDGSDQRNLELEIAHSCVDIHGVIMFDDYHKWQPELVHFLQQHPDWTPFLADSKALYLHHVSHQADEFLDCVVEQRFQDFCHTGNCDYHGHWVKTVTPRPIDIVYMSDIFPLFAKQRNI